MNPEIDYIEFDLYSPNHEECVRSGRIVDRIETAARGMENSNSVLYLVAMFGTNLKGKDGKDIEIKNGHVVEIRWEHIRRAIFKK